MKKLIAFVLAVVLVITVLAVAIPAVAKTQPGEVSTVFEADIVRVAGCTDPLTQGEGYVRADGSIKVEIEGAVPNKWYRVFLTYGPDIPGPIPWGPVWVQADSQGDFVVTGSVSGGPYGMPRFVVNTGGGTQTLFNSGFEIP
jgi:hypothetical protein